MTIDGGIRQDHEAAKALMPRAFRQCAPMRLKLLMSRWYWRSVDALDYLVELTGLIPSHRLRLLLYRRLFFIKIGPMSSIHRCCRFYRPSGVNIGSNVVVNRDVLLDGRSGLSIGNNTSISEGAHILTMEHDPNSPTFALRGSPVMIGGSVFLGARSTILPGITIGEGAVVAAGAVVTHDVEPYTVVGGVPARPIGLRSRDLSYELDYRKFLG